MTKRTTQETKPEPIWYVTRDGQHRCIDQADKKTAKQLIIRFTPKGTK